jgi:hypothetical protein
MSKDASGIWYYITIGMIDTSVSFSYHPSRNSMKNETKKEMDQMTIFKESSASNNIL